MQEQLAAVKREAAHPAAEAWGEAMSLIEALDKAPDPKDARLRLRALLQQQVKEIWVLVMPLSPARRVCTVQVFFEGDVRRDYLISSQSAGNYRRAEFAVRSFADAVPGAGGLDLRRREDAAALEAMLGKVKLDALAGASADAV